MSDEFKQFLTQLGIGSSKTTAYNPRGNSQCERYNGIIWNTILLALESKGLPISAWQDVLHDALNAIRSLLCTTTNATPHERMFNFERRSSTGTALPVWLCEPGEVLLKRFGNRSKYDPIVEVVELLEANPTHAKIRHNDGREDSVALRHLARFPRSIGPQDSAGDTQTHMDHAYSTPLSDGVPVNVPSPVPSPYTENELVNNSQNPENQPSQRPGSSNSELPPRRSSRIRRPVKRLDL